MIEQSADATQAGSILVVADNPTAQRLVRTVLEWTFGRVTTCSSSQEAVRLAVRRSFDTILVDLGGNGSGEGLACVRQIRRFGIGAPAVLAVTPGSNSLYDALYLHTLGVHAVLERPYALESLEDLLLESTALSQPQAS